MHIINISEDQQEYGVDKDSFERVSSTSSIISNSLLNFYTWERNSNENPENHKKICPNISYPTIRFIETPKLPSYLFAPCI
jgi:hypothetical protein